MYRYLILIVTDSYCIPVVEYFSCHCQGLDFFAIEFANRSASYFSILDLSLSAKIFLNFSNLGVITNLQ